MSLLVELAAWVVAQGHGTAVGTDVFRGNLPPTPDAAIGLVGTGGGPSVRSFGRVEWMQPTVQVFVRRTTQDAAEAAAYALWTTFAAMTAQSLSGTAYRGATPIQPPYEFETDDRERVVYAFNVELIRAGN